MQYLKCECGDREVWTSGMNMSCMWCKKCNTTPAHGPSGHKTVQPPHEMSTAMVPTDSGKMSLSTCVSCGHRKDQLVGEPMVDMEGNKIA